jgi:hypothetical protein
VGEQQQQEPVPAPQARRQALHWEPPQSNLESQPEAAQEEPNYHPDSNSVPAHQPEPEQALNSCIRSK